MSEPPEHSETSASECSNRQLAIHTTGAVWPRRTMRGTKRHDESTAQRQSGPVLEPVTSALSACRVGQRADTSCVRGVGHVATGTCREAEVISKSRAYEILGAVRRIQPLLTV